MTRVCVNCEQEHPLNDEYFPKRVNSQGEFTYLSRCRECQRAYNLEMKRRQRSRDLQKGINREFK